MSGFFLCEKFIKKEVIRLATQEKISVKELFKKFIDIEKCRLNEDGQYEIVFKTAPYPYLFMRDYCYFMLEDGIQREVNDFWKISRHIVNNRSFNRLKIILPAEIKKPVKIFIFSMLEMKQGKVNTIELRI